MNQMLAICSFEIRRVFKQKKSWLLMFVMPIVFTFVFGMTGGDGPVKTRLALVDQDRSTASKALLRQVSQTEMLDVSEVTEEAADGLLHDKKVAGVVMIPKGYEEVLKAEQDVQVTFRHGPDVTVAPTIRQAIDDAMSLQSVQVRGAKTLARLTGETNWQDTYEKKMSAPHSPLVTVEEKTVTKHEDKKELSGRSHVSIGFSIMFVMISLMSVTGSILQARQIGVWYRMMSAPLSRLQVLGGYMLSFFLTGWLQFGILMLLSNWLFGVEWGNWLGMIVLVSAFLLCVVGLGMCIAGFVKTTEQQSAIGSIVIVSTSMLGGVYWSLDIVSDTMRKIGDFMPQSWVMKGFTELVVGGGGVGDILGSVGVLLCFAAVFLVAGVSRVRYE